MGRLEFPILLLFIHFGGLFALRRHTFRDRLIALERVTLASYVFVTFERQNRFSTYAGVQYFILGSFPSAMLLLAFALFYLQSGSRAFQDMDLFFNTTYELSSCNFITDETTKLSYRNSNMSKNFIKVSTQLVIPLLEGNGEFYSAFPMDKIESIASSLNPINSRTVVALGLLFFNFFFKITAAPFHV